MSDRIIKIGDTMYYIKGTMDAEKAQNKGTEYWKRCWGADAVLRNARGIETVELFVCIGNKNMFENL